MKIGAVSKIVAFIPGGYDNVNEDRRYGAIQTFIGSGIVDNTVSGANLSCVSCSGTCDTHCGTAYNNTCQSCTSTSSGSSTRRSSSRAAAAVVLVAVEAIDVVVVAVVVVV